MNFLKQRWERLTPKTRQMLVIGIVGGFIMFALYLFVSANPEMTTTSEKETIVKDILTGADMRQLGVGGLDNRTQQLEAKVQELTEQFGQLQSELNKTRQSRLTPNEMERILAKFRREFGGQLMDQVRDQIDSRPPSDVFKENEDGANQISEEERAKAIKRRHDQASRSDIWERPADVAQRQSNSTMPAGTSPNQKPSVSTAEIRVIGAKPEQTEAEKAAARDTGVYLPAGSIVSGVLITGMDAPTHNAARSQPYPALIRVKKDAILPNRFRLDIRECFIIASGYGSLSAERAYLRAEVLSCVRQDGGVIEVGLEAYAVGEDGKVGLRGRVVSKQGQMLAKSMAAGFFAGMSQVFGDAPVPTIITESSDDVQYQDVLSGDSMTAGAVQGASTALDRLAQYYLDMAKNIFPVIEINANRRIDFIVTQSVTLQTVGPAATTRTAANGNSDEQSEMQP